MTSMGDQQTINSVLQSQVRWSQAANAMKKRLDRARLSVLALSALGTVAATLAATFLHPYKGLSQFAASLAAAALAAVAILTAQQLNPTSTRRWARTRAVSEGIKALIFKFRAGVAPFTGEGAPAKLQNDVADLEDLATDLLGHLPPIESTRTPDTPSPLSHDDYINTRLIQQIDEYYRPRARYYAVIARRLRIVESAFLIAAAVMAALGGVTSTSTFAPWAAALTSLGGFLAAHHAARRYEFLVDSYTATANRLQRRIDRWRSSPGPPEPDSWSQFVEDCEAVIAAENQTWVAKWADSGR